MNKKGKPVHHSNAHKRVMTKVPLWTPDWGQSGQQEGTEVGITSALKPYGFSCSV